MNAEDKIVPYRVSMPGTGSALVFAPHADDESFGMGGTILRARAEGRQVQLVIMTDGALGGAQSGLVEKRKQEARAAAKLLGIGTLIFLDEPDRGLQVSPVLSNKIADLIRSSAAQTVFFPGIFEPHPDHRTTALLVWAALGQLAQSERPEAVAYEISVQNPVNCLVDISDYMDGKKALMQLYSSQLAENNYPEIVQALNKLRTFTLSPEVKFAEGFYCFAREDLECSLQAVMAKYLNLLF